MECLDPLWYKNKELITPFCTFPGSTRFCSIKISEFTSLFLCSSENIWRRAFTQMWFAKKFIWSLKYYNVLFPRWISKAAAFWIFWCKYWMLLKYWLKVMGEVSLHAVGNYMAFCKEVFARGENISWLQSVSGKFRI